MYVLLIRPIKVRTYYIMNPIKYMIKDLKSKPVPFEVWLQGNLESKVGDDIILSDSTGKVKVSGCDEKDKILGAYCCVIGVAVNTKDMPEVKAAKFITISSNHKYSWEQEVQEAHSLLEGLIVLKL